jgi:hypothetical protein
VTSCGFTVPKVAPKPTPSPVYSPPVPSGDISEDAWCANVIANPSPSGCGLYVAIYECAHGMYSVGCPEIITADGYEQWDPNPGPPVYPPGCTAQLPRCTSAWSLTPARLDCYCESGPWATDGGYGWNCPN